MWTPSRANQELTTRRPAHVDSRGTPNQATFLNREHLDHSCFCLADSRLSNDPEKHSPSAGASRRHPGEIELESESLDSSESLGLDKVQLQALCSSINKDLGFDNSQVPQDMMDIIKSDQPQNPSRQPFQV